jgi:opacity protein-like surface antigen
MKRILAAALLYGCISTSASAAPLYTGLQIDDNTAGVLLGHQINRTYAVEAHYSKSSSRTSQDGLTIDTSSVGLGIVGIALFPMRVHEMQPYDLFLKAGFERTSITDKYSIPTSVTLTLPYSGTIYSHKNQLIFGGGAELDLTKNMTGRIGLDFLGNKRSIYLSAIFNFN